MSDNITVIPQKKFFEVKNQSGEPVMAEFLMTFTLEEGKWAGNSYMAFYVPTGRKTPSDEDERIVSFARAEYVNSEQIVLSDIGGGDERGQAVIAFAANVNRLKAAVDLQDRSNG